MPVERVSGQDGADPPGMTSGGGKRGRDGTSKKYVTISNRA